MALLVRALAVAALMGLGAWAPLRAQEMEVPVAMQLPLFLKVMSFDRQLRTRSAGEIVIAIAYQGGYRASADAKAAAWQVTSGIRDIGGIPVVLVAIDLDREGLAAALARSRVTLLYVAPMRGVDLRELIVATRAAQVTTLSGVVRYVESGLAVGVRLRGDRPRILVNLAASRLEGAEFSAELLKLAQVL